MPEVLEPPPVIGSPVRPPIDPAIRAQARAMVAAHVSVAQTARNLGLNEGTVRAWSTREGWTTAAHRTSSQAPKDQKLKLVAGTVTRLPSQAGESTRRKLASSVDKLADAVDAQDVSGPKSLKTVASAVKLLTDSAKVIHGWSAEDNTQYAFAAVMGEIVQQEEPTPAIDVESTKASGQH